jgi:hypothetical protein
MKLINSLISNDEFEKQYKKEKKVKLGITSTGHGLSNLITCVFFLKLFF